MSGNLRTHLINPHAICLAVSFVVLAGCAAPMQTTRAVVAPEHASWIDPAAQTGDLLYVSDLGANDVAVYTYPGGTLVGKLNDFAAVAGLCADKAGDIFVVDEAGPVVVYAHGGTSPLRTLATMGAPYGCAVDPVTGNLALTNLSSYIDGAIAIYPKAKGKPKLYYNRKIVDSTYFCGYDDSGNLYVDGWNRSAQFIFLKLPKGGASFRIATLKTPTNDPGGVEWDGKYVAVGDKGSGKVYRIDGATNKIEQTIALKNGTNVEQFWLSGTTLVGPNFQGGGPVGYWRYPSGGSPTKTIGGLYEPFGAAVSVGKP